MTKNSLPKYIQPFKQAERGTHLHGKLPLSSFPRLTEVLSTPEGDVEITLELHRDQENIPCLTGSLKSCLSLICQRCLKSLPYSLTTSISLSPVFNEKAAKKLPKRYEPLFLTEDHTSLIDMIEDELLLAIPNIPKHKNEDCKSPN